jgi:hypothetical protein
MPRRGPEKGSASTSSRYEEAEQHGLKLCMEWINKEPDLSSLKEGTPPLGWSVFK